MAQIDDMRAALEPLIEEYGRGDTEHAGLEVQATLVYFCRTGKVKMNWRDVPRIWLEFAEKEN